MIVQSQNKKNFPVILYTINIVTWHMVPNYVPTGNLHPSYN